MRKRPVMIVAQSGSLEFYAALPLNGERLRVFSATEAPAVAGEVEPDLVLIDCGADAERGLRLLEECKRLRPGTPVIFVADPGCGDCALRAPELGARAVFFAPVSLSELQGAIFALLWLKRSAIEKRVSLEAARRELLFCPLPQLSISPPENIQRAVGFIESNFRRPLFLAQIAAVACLSRYHFSRVFRKHVGLSPFQFLAYVRVRRALEVLATGRHTILSAGLQVGYRDQREFIRQFRKFTGTTPSRYLKSLRAGRPDRAQRPGPNSPPERRFPSRFSGS